jgi:prephenate dehydratase
MILPLDSKDTLEAAEVATAPLRICIQGYPGAFHDIAARRVFAGRALEIVPALTFEKLVATTELGEEADVALMAIENTLAGSLMANYKLLSKSNLTIIGEVYLRVKQNLLVLPGQKIEDLTEVHSHPIAIEQCREFFRNYPNIRLVEMEDTALSARNLHEHQQGHIGAIASTWASELYELEILDESIETNKQNYTRFLVLQPSEVAQPVENPDKFSISFAVDHTVGSLYKVLAVLAAYNVNLTKIQSAPIIGQPWEYMFYVDFVAQGLVSPDLALEAIRPITHSLKLYGAYRQGEHYQQ